MHAKYFLLKERKIHLSSRKKQIVRYQSETVIMMGQRQASQDDVSVFSHWTKAELPREGGFLASALTNGLLKYQLLQSKRICSTPAPTPEANQTRRPGQKSIIIFTWQITRNHLDPLSEDRVSQHSRLNKRMGVLSKRQQ